MASTEELRARRAAQRSRRFRRRRLVALGGLAALAGCSGIGFGLSGGEDDPRPATPRAPSAADLPAPQLVGQRLIAGFDGTRVPGGLRRMIARGRLAGVILFADNVAGRGETRELVRELQRIDRPDGLRMPLAVMVDQEGGLVKRFDGPPATSAEEMGKRGSAYARAQGRATARNLRRHGANVDLAPVVDVGRRGAALTEELRTFGGTRRRVVEVGVGGFAAGLRQGGVAATAKHFPGLGAARVNTDAASQEITLSRARLRAVDEGPFAAFARSGGELVMLSLATYDAFADRPAALSRKLATGELRRRLGFEGVSITDSLDAAAALEFAGRERVALAAAGAGTDLLLYGSWRTARDVSRPLRRGLAAGALDRDRFEASVDRVLSLRRGLAD